jgi:molybdate transport system ATP-binding protein
MAQDGLNIDLGKTLQTAQGPLRLQLRAELDAGGFLTLFGPSGAGKTTVLRMLAGLVRPDDGRIAMNGECWFDADARIDLPPQRRPVGFVFQDYALFPNMTVEGNVSYAAPGDRTWVDELLTLTGLDGLRHRRPDTLSGGQKQRVALARALARKPALLLLDEPLSALDAELRARLQDDLQRLQQRCSFTTILVSHDIGEVFKLSQQVLRLENGRVVQSGTPAEVFLLRRPAGKLQLQAQVLAVRREDVVHVVSLLVGQDIVEVLASGEEAVGLRPGDTVSVAAKAINPMILKK